MERKRDETVKELEQNIKTLDSDIENADFCKQNPEGVTKCLKSENTADAQGSENVSGENMSGEEPRPNLGREVSSGETDKRQAYDSASQLGTQNAVFLAGSKKNQIEHSMVEDVPDRSTEEKTYPEQRKQLQPKGRQQAKQETKSGGTDKEQTLSDSDIREYRKGDNTIRTKVDRNASGSDIRQNSGSIKSSENEQEKTSAQKMMPQRNIRNLYGMIRTVVPTRENQTSASYVADTVTRAVSGSIFAVLGGFGLWFIIIILLVCMVLGINVWGGNTESIDELIAEINQEYEEKIMEALAADGYDAETNAGDKLTVVGQVTPAREVIALYAVISMYTDGQIDIADVVDVRSMFWDLNKMSATHQTGSVSASGQYDTTDDNGSKIELIVPVTKYDENGNAYIEYVEKDGGDNALFESVDNDWTSWTVYIDSMDLASMSYYYGLTDEQKELFEFLLSEEGQELLALNPGTSVDISGMYGGDAMVAVALGELGNKGGEKYWKWYGFESRVGWCAIFTSWVAKQCGYLEGNGLQSIVPNTASVTWGADWFKAKGQWQQPNYYTPKAGDYIYFDWDMDGVPDHVGIVAGCDATKVYAIEGNTSDAVHERTYNRVNGQIYGYGTPAYGAG